MKDMGFRSGFMAAVFMFIGIAVVVLAGKSMLPSVGEAFVLESVPEFSESASADVEAPSNEDLSVSTSSAVPSAPVSSSAVISSSTVSVPPESASASSVIPTETPETSSSAPVSSEPPEIPTESSVTESVPSVSSQESAPQTSETVSSSSESVSGLININTAAAYELQRLNGIGEVKARAIIDYREQNGGFSSVDELINVKGIGEKTLEKIRADITV